MTYVQLWIKKIIWTTEKKVLSLTPQAMYNQFKRPSAGSVRELYYIYRKTYDLRSNESRDHYHEDGYLVPSSRYGFVLKLFLGFET